MATSTIRNWERKELAVRQQLIRDFYVTNNRHLARAFLDLVRAPKGYGVFASIGPRIQYGIFGRDSIEVAEDLLDTQPELAREVILLLARLQGVRTDKVSEEELGKIHHEYRRGSYNGQRISHVSQVVLKKLVKDWRIKDNQLLYYGSYDATPLYIRLVHRYVQRHGKQILSRKVRGKDGGVRTVSEHVHMATNWLVGKVQASEWELFEDRRLNRHGLLNQEWEDSNEAYVHTNGELANADGGVAAIELQGYTYDALLAAADLVAAPEEAIAWRKLAHRVQEQTLSLLWMPDKKYFAMGLDRDETGKRRQITTLNSNPALLLETNLLSDLPDDKARPYVEGIIHLIRSDDFMTAAGVRLRSLKHVNLVGYADYHGSLVSWPKQTYDIAKGLRKHNHQALADKLEDEILDSVSQAGEFYEFFLIDQKGRVKYRYRREFPDEPTLRYFSAAVLPEAGQAWTISAVLAIVASRQQKTP